MSDSAFSQDWLEQLSDPYAVLGVPVTADERRILKRYRQVAKQLHPDIQATKSAINREFAGQVLARLVNPAYQRIKQDRGRKETLATLRFKVRRLTRDNMFSPTTQAGQALMNTPSTELEVFYEKSVAEISAQQFEAPASFDAITRLIGELNLVYLRRKMGDPVIREKRTGLVATSRSPIVPSPTVSSKLSDDSAETTETQQLTYAERHCRRAQAYLDTGNISAAIQELKDAVKINPRNSNYHCLLGQAYLLQKLPGMAKVHIRQSLRLNPKNPIARKYARQLQVDLEGLKPSVATTKQVPSKLQKSGFLRSLFSRR